MWNSTQVDDIKGIYIEKDIINFLKMKNRLKMIIFLFCNDICAHAFVSNFKSLSYDMIW